MTNPKRVKTLIDVSKGSDKYYEKIKDEDSQDSKSPEDTPKLPKNKKQNGWQRHDP